MALSPSSVLGEEANEDLEPLPWPGDRLLDLVEEVDEAPLALHGEPLDVEGPQHVGALARLVGQAQEGAVQVLNGERGQAMLG